MTELLRQATDDQIAIAICAGGLFVSGLIMYFSYHVGQLTTRVRLHDESQSVRFPSAPQPSLSQEPAVREKAA